MFLLLLAIVVLYFMWFWIGWWIAAVVAGFFGLGFFLVWLESKKPEWFPSRQKRKPKRFGIEFQMELPSELEVTVREREERDGKNARL